MAALGPHNDGESEMKDCVKCNEPVDGNECPFCKWNEDKQAYGITRDVDLNRLCAHVSEGQRCANAGVHSTSTLGSASFYCWQHSFDRRGPLSVHPPRVEPHSSTLTEAQWYAVCKHFPHVARRCSRPFADVGPHNPLDATSKLGPLLDGMSDAQRERAAIQSE
jgi:hypothetical protein